MTRAFFAAFLLAVLSAGVILPSAFAESPASKESTLIPHPPKGRGEHCVAIQHPLNITQDAPAMLAVCAEFNLASLNRSPLAMGLFTGKFNAQTTFPEDDVRSGWNMQAGWQATGLEQLPRLRAVLTQDGRSLAQAALGWLLDTLAQVRENVAAMRFGKLGLQQMLEIDSILGR